MLVVRCFNPLDRGNLYLIQVKELFPTLVGDLFQSPRSGKFVSNAKEEIDDALNRFKEVSIP